MSGTRITKDLSWNFQIFLLNNDMIFIFALPYIILPHEIVVTSSSFYSFLVVVGTCVGKEMAAILLYDTHS